MRLIAFGSVVRTILHCPRLTSLRPPPFPHLPPPPLSLSPTSHLPFTPLHQVLPAIRNTLFSATPGSRAFFD